MVRAKAMSPRQSGLQRKKTIVGTRLGMRTFKSKLRKASTEPAMRSSSKCTSPTNETRLQRLRNRKSAIGSTSDRRSNLAGESASTHNEEHSRNQNQPLQQSPPKLDLYDNTSIKDDRVNIVNPSPTLNEDSTKDLPLTPVPPESTRNAGKLSVARWIPVVTLLLKPFFVTAKKVQRGGDIANDDERDDEHDVLENDKYTSTSMQKHKNQTRNRIIYSYSTRASSASSGCPWKVVGDTMGDSTPVSRRQKLTAKLQMSYTQRHSVCHANMKKQACNTYNHNPFTSTMSTPMSACSASMSVFTATSPATCSEQDQQLQAYTIFSLSKIVQKMRLGGAMNPNRNGNGRNNHPSEVIENPGFQFFEDDFVEFVCKHQCGDYGEHKASRLRHALAKLLSKF